MKKLLLSILAVAAITACSKMDVEYDAPAEIKFTPIADNVTKSMMTGETFLTSESFNVWAWYKQVGAGTSVTNWGATANEHLYINEGEFVSRNESTWGGKTPYYWPKVGSLLFAGYYPTSVKDKVDYTFNATTNQMVFTGINQSVVDNDGYTEDLMYFNMTPISYSSDPVEVVFKHALSWATVNLSRTSANTNNATYPQIKVNYVTFTNVKPQGTGTVTGTDGTISWATTGTAAPTTVTPEDGVVLSTTAAKQAEPLFIPQTFNDNMELQVNYTIYSSLNEYFTETYSVKLSTLTPSTTDATHTAWLPGKHYIYNVSVGIEEILIEPTVTAWDEVVVPVPIQ